MPFTDADARAPLGAGWPELILPDGELSVDDAAFIFGVGATVGGEVTPPEGDGGGYFLRRRRRIAALRARAVV